MNFLLNWKNALKNCLQILHILSYLDYVCVAFINSKVFSVTNYKLGQKLGPFVNFFCYIDVVIHKYSHF